MITSRNLSIRQEPLPASKRHRFAVVLLALALSIPPACAERMSLEEARQVAVVVNEGESFTPPPRRIDDILAILEAGGGPVKINDEMEVVAASSPPVGADAAAMIEFYLTRGMAAWEVGRQEQALADLRNGLDLAKGAKIRNERLMVRLAKIERAHGNYRRALALVERLQTFSDSLPMLEEVVMLYGELGDVANAKKAYEAANSKLQDRRRPPRPEALFHVERMRAVIAELEGRWNEAEVHIRSAISHLSKIQKSSPVPRINHRLWLSKSLMLQERFVEAEFELRQVFKESLSQLGLQSIFTLRAVDGLVDVTLAQGRGNDAERLARAQLKLIEAAAVSPRSPVFTRAKISLGNVLSAKCEFSRALEYYEVVRSGRGDFQKGKFSPKNLNLILALLMTGRTEEARPLVRRAMEVCRDRFGEGHFLTAEVMALDGLAEARAGRKKEAIVIFGKSLPVLIASVTGEGRDFLKTQRLKTILEEYLELLSEIQMERRERELGIDPVAEGFKIADALRSRSVQGAVAASSARATATDPDLAELIRKEQDAQNQIAAIQEMLVDMLASSEEEQVPQLVKDLKARMELQVKSRDVILDEIKSRFPKYADFVSPEPPSMQQAAGLLRAGEALLSAYTAESKTYLWLLTGVTARFAVTDLGRVDLQRLVNEIRKGLDPKPQTLGDIPEFDFEKGYALFTRLLKPLEAHWKKSGDLIVVSGGPLGQIPLAILPTSPFRPGKDEGALFSSYRTVPWLVRTIPVTMVPSVSSFVSLRTLPQTAGARRPMAGFGDPIFNRIQLADARDEQQDRQTPAGRIGVRGIRTAGGVGLDEIKKDSTRLESLGRLPDTREELKGICDALGGDFAADVFIGQGASEHRIKAMDLSDRRVIAFATHALIPGDLDGLEQPALALSSPSVTGEKDDGLLTMSEIMKLKLNADWVVLSACNTGAAEGEGAEAVSGLGRAFFYAGSRSLLVSMWPVETTSARLLTTGLFQFQREDPELSSSAALRKSILDLIDRRVLRDPETGKTVATYAHPMFWAPFVLVGETGR
jgi:CHAT domain-containing protein/tetratricopeptide (TPR) repeat protein